MEPYVRVRNVGTRCWRTTNALVFYFTHSFCSSFLVLVFVLSTIKQSRFAFKDFNYFSAVLYSNCVKMICTTYLCTYTLQFCNHITTLYIDFSFIAKSFLTKRIIIIDLQSCQRGIAKGDTIIHV